MVQLIYRGDGDYRTERDLKSLLRRGMVKTNLVSGGNGREIFERPIIESIKNHVNNNWRKTHFLSFTEDIDRAFVFAKGRDNINREFDNYYEDDDNWDFTLLKLETKNLFNVIEVENGIYKAQFTPGLFEFKPVYNLIMIDVVKTLHSFTLTTDQDKNAMLNAKRDKEWLILPSNLKNFGVSVEFSGLLDCDVFSEINKFKLI